MASPTKDTSMGVSDWNCEYWEKDIIGFHNTEVKRILVKHMDKLTLGKSCTIFVPLCGKSLDMKWFYDEGHSVVGVEGADKAAAAFFNEQNIEFTVNEVPEINGKLYQSDDGRIKIYCCDIFDFKSSVDGPFEAFWDTGAFGAINVVDRPRYAALLKSLMSPKARILVATFSYDEAEYPGPPRNVSQKTYEDLFGDTCSIELIDAEEETDELKKYFGVTSLSEEFRLITGK